MAARVNTSSRQSPGRARVAGQGATRGPPLQWTNQPKRSSALSKDQISAERLVRGHSPGGSRSCTTPGYRTLSTDHLSTKKRNHTGRQSPGRARVAGQRATKGPPLQWTNQTVSTKKHSHHSGRMRPHQGEAIEIIEGNKLMASK